MHMLRIYYSDINIYLKGKKDSSIYINRKHIHKNMNIKIYT